MTGNGRTNKPAPTMSPKPEKWTWQMAEEALAKNTLNRNLRDNDVAKYAREMQTGLWGVPESKQGYRGSVMPLVFDWDGNLIDGQHRLTAQVKTKTTQYWYVARNQPNTVQRQIDQLITRSAADILKFAGYANSAVLQGVARWGWLLEAGLANSGHTKVANEEIVDMLIRHPDLVHSAQMGPYGTSGLFYKLLGPTPIGAAHWWIAQFNDHAEADIWIERLRHMNRERDGSAILALLSRFDSARKGSENISTRTQIAMIVRAWNLDVERSFVHRLPSRSRTGDYPVPEPLKRIESQEDSFGPTGAATDEPMTGAGEEGPVAS
jgi:hypothetical protein